MFRFGIAPLVRDPVQGEDLLADTFVRALENIQRFRWQGRGILPWLIRIAKNRCLDHLRRSGRIGDWSLGPEQFLPDLEALGADGVLEETEMSAILRKRIASCLEGINPRYRRVLELRLLQRMDREAASDAMQVSMGTLDVLLFRACRAFRRVYVAQFGANGGDSHAGDLDALKI